MTQTEALNILKLGHNAYITGPAGSGKTYLLNQFIAYLREHNVDVGITASTGIAATHMGGVTIHSWTGLGIKSHVTEHDLEAMTDKKYLAKRMEKVKVLIIDEVSMLHDFRLNLIDQIMQAFKGNNKPFGDVQLVLCGDFFQLPPVSRQGEPESLFIYHSESWRSANLKICYLEEQFRQTDDAALQVLNGIRRNLVTPEIRTLLDQSHKRNKKGHIAPPTRLFTHNVDVDQINEEELQTIDGTMVTYTMNESGNEVLVSMLKKSCLAPERLRLKKGARVMFVKNNFEAGYVNGTLGEVVELKGEYQGPIIKVSKSGELIQVECESWKIEEDGVTKAEIKQYPLRLAWAITVHKSQGMSLDAVEVDLSKSFERGMGYVALSRVRTMAGLTILGLNEEALKVNDEVLEYDEILQEQSAKAVQDILKPMSAKELAEKQKKYIASIGSPKKPEKTDTYEITLDLIGDGMSIKEIATRRKMTEETIINHIEKLVERDPFVLEELDHIRRAIPHRHFKTISEALLLKYEESKDWRLAPVKDYLDKNKKVHRLSPAPTYRDIQLVKIFMKADQGK